MKKIILISFIIGIIFPFITNGATLQERELLIKRISILLEMVKSLQLQLAELQTKQNKSIGGTVLLKEEILPAKKEVSVPVINVQIGLIRIIDQNTVFQIYPAKSIFVEKNFRVKEDKYRVLININKPNGTNEFTCEKFGVWSGQTEAQNHWEEDLYFTKSGKVGVRCIANGIELSSGFATLEIEK